MCRLPRADRLGSILLLLALTGGFAPVQSAAASAWGLSQNDPNPFCPTRDNVTAIRVDIAQACVLEVRIWDSTRSRTVRQFDSLTIAGPGWLWMRWDGRDDAGALVKDGDYPYEVRATAGSGGALLFTRSRVAQVDCPTAAVPSTWDRVKHLYR